jgi:hypothetical protein
MEQLGHFLKFHFLLYQANPANNRLGFFEPIVQKKRMGNMKLLPDLCRTEFPGLDLALNYP